MTKVVTIILAGGQGSRLYPLTKKRSKPAVPIAGNFRLIDIPISNCLHSGLRKIFISTQFSSESLHRHIFLTYRFDNFTKDYVTVLSAQQTSESSDWYQGTADAVRQNLRFLHPEGDLVLILSGDHLYRMDYKKFIEFHLDLKADISISVSPIFSTQAPEFGIIKVDSQGRIISFYEKPDDPSILEEAKISEEVFKRFGLEAGGRTHLASMGIYIFKWEVLKEFLEETNYQDFGKEVIPEAIKRKKVFSYFFGDYWADIGTIKNFFDTHMDLTSTLPKFNFYDEEKPIYTHPRFLPGAKILGAEVENSILSTGSIINKSKIYNSIIGIRSRIGSNCLIERTVMMGADYYETKEEIMENHKKGIPSIGIGNNCEIRNAIIDKNVRVGHNVKLINTRNVTNEETEKYVIRDGIIVIPKGICIPDGTII